MPRSFSLEQAHSATLRRWQAPFPGFTSGQDPRTSDNALLVLTYGGLDQAARHAWLNAGRRLIDKTYVEILRHVQGLTCMRTWRAVPIAAARAAASHAGVWRPCGAAAHSADAG